MIYIYDLLVNLNEEIIDFYDWEETDNYEHIRKCLLMKVSKDDYYNILSNNIILNEELLKEIKGKAQKFSGRNTIVIDYIVTITDGINALMIKFDKNGYSTHKSKFLINEEMEITSLSDSLKIYDIKYTILDKKENNTMTRKEMRLVNLILHELNYIKNDKEKIDYLYYEWFDTNVGENKLDKLIESIKSYYSDKHQYFLNVLDLITNK